MWGVDNLAHNTIFIWKFLNEEPEYEKIRAFSTSENSPSVLSSVLHDHYTFNNRTIKGLYTDSGTDLKDQYIYT